MKQLIYDKFVEQFNYYKRHTRELISIPSVSDDIENVTKALEYIVELARSFDLHAYTVLDNRVGVVEYGEGKETFGLLAHTDIVPVEESDWEYPPFDLTEIEGILYGRGIVDDKGPIVLMLYILKIMKELDFKPSKKIQLIIGTQEEVVWTDMYDYVKEFKLPDFGFTPDGEFPIQNAEKGYLDLKLVFDKGDVEFVDAGNATNSIPSNFICKVNGRTYKATGKACHSSQPENGVNAILKGIKLIDDEDKHKSFEFLEKYFKDCNGRDMGIYEENYVNGDILNLTALSPNIMKMEDDKIAVYVNFRLAVKDTYDKIINFLDSHKAEYGFTYEVLDLMQPIYVNENQGFIQTMKKEYDAVMNTDVEFDLAFGTSYAKAMPNFVSFGPMFPDSLDTCHEANEQIMVDELLKAQKIYVNTIYEIVK